MVLVSQTQPTAASNKIWIDPDAREIEIPTMDDLNELKDDLSDMQDEIDSFEGISDEVKEALLACFEHVAWIDEYGQDYYDDLYNVLYDVEPEVISISADYLQSRISDIGESLDTIKSDLIVTATYEDSTERTIRNYSLNGELSVDGRNTITVSYKGISTTIVVLAAPANRWVNDVITIPSSNISYGYIYQRNPPDYHNTNTNRGVYTGAWIDFDYDYIYTITVNSSYSDIQTTGVGLSKLNMRKYAKGQSIEYIDHDWQTNGSKVNEDNTFTGKDITMLFIPFRRSNDSTINLSNITNITIVRRLKGV